MLRSYLRWTLRFWGRRRATSTILLLVLCIGIGSATAVFSVVSGVLLRPLPFAHEEDLVHVSERQMASGSDTRTSGITFREWQGTPDLFDGLSAYTEGSLDYVGPQGPLEIESASVEGSFFRVLGVAMALGRGLEPADDVVGAPPVAVIGYDLWRGTFGADPEVVGRTVRFGNRTVEIVGVAPPRFDYPGRVAAWVPLFGDPGSRSWSSIRGARFLSVIGRLSAGVTAAEARARLTAIMRAEPELEGWGTTVSSLRDTLVREVRAPLWILFGCVIVFLLIACLNVSVVLLSQTRGRRRELAIRRALGARGERLAGQLLVESLVVVGAGALLGVLLAGWEIDILMALSPRELPETASLTLDGRVLAFAIGITLFTAIVATIAPLFQARRVRVSSALGQGHAGAGDRRDRGVWNGLVVSEVALTVVLLVGAGLLIRSFASLVAVDTGLDADGVTTFHVSLPDYRYDTPAARAAFQTALVARARELPGVESAALARNLPLAGSSMTSPVQVERAADAERPSSTEFTTVTSDYFRTLGIGLVEGRTFRPSDDAGAPPVAVVSESFARAVFPGRSPIGDRARTLFGPPIMREIVGVVEDVRHAGPRVDAPPMFYAPQAQMETPFFFLIVRSSASPAAIAAQIGAAVRDLDPELPLADVSTMRDLLSESVAEPRFYASVLAYFAVLALVLATVGLFGLLVQRALARRREIGIRMALGARGSDAIGLIVWQGLRLVGTGTAIGLLGALAASRLVAGLLYGVTPNDPITYIAVTVILLLAGGVASLGPARRAATVDPVAAIRN